MRKLAIFVALSLLASLGVVAGAGQAAPPDPYADQVVSFTQGHVWDDYKTNPPGTWGWTKRPKEALGSPSKPAGFGNAYFVSLGANPAGEIVLKFTDWVLVDGDENVGYDLVIFEFGARDDAHVYVANDSERKGRPGEWVYIGYTAIGATVSREQGYYPPSMPQESSAYLFMFDLAGKLESIGGWANYIKIVDDNAGRSDANFTDGFDLNAVQLLNYVDIAQVTTNTPESKCNDGDCDDCDDCDGDPCGYAGVPFFIEHAKLYIYKDKKTNDGKVYVKGRINLDQAGGCGSPPDKQVTVYVGPVYETITMVEQGKKNEYWRYKRPKGSGGKIKDMKIDWGKGKFDFRMDKVNLTGVQNPVTISIQVGDCYFEETITMREKKYHWDYKAHYPYYKYKSGDDCDDDD